ncbi:MAG TPA: hypothetical protein VNR89_04135 [Roseomonas sp.]|nr:hypothetical protein [Roseomonas sp.]
MNVWLAKASGAGLDTLHAFRSVGASLLDAKEILSGQKGAFGAWCDDNFKFSKEWRARLMKLAAAWDDFLAAKEWAEGQGRLLGRKEYSVDGALAFINEWKKATNPAPEGEGEDGSEGGEGEGASAKAKKKSQAEILREQLAEALERIRALEAELAKAKGQKAGAKAEQKAEQPGGAKPVDGATKNRARKVWGLYEKGATQGERDAAKARLEEMAQKFGMDFDAFVRACGLA